VSAKEFGAKLAMPKPASHCCHSAIAFKPKPEEPWIKRTTGILELFGLGDFENEPT
jgi:hypothetical protein